MGLALALGIRVGPSEMVIRCRMHVNDLISCHGLHQIKLWFNVVSINII